MKVWELNQSTIYLLGFRAEESQSRKSKQTSITGDQSDDYSTLFTCLIVAMTKEPHLGFWIKNMEFSDPKCL